MSPVWLQWALLPSSGKQANQPPAMTGSSQDEAGTQSVGCRFRLGPNCLVISSQQTKYCTGSPVPWAFSFSLKPSQFDRLLAGMPSPQIHILNTQLAQLQTRTKTEPGLCQMGMKSRQRELPISPEAPQGFPLPSGSSELPRAPPPFFPPMTGLSLALTKGFGDISWTCTASILQRKEGEDQ